MIFSLDDSLQCYLNVSCYYVTFRDDCPEIIPKQISDLPLHIKKETNWTISFFLTSLTDKSIESAALWFCLCEQMFPNHP